MRHFTFQAVAKATDAMQASAMTRAGSHIGAPTQYLAGGTTMLDLMKLDVMRPTRAAASILDLSVTNSEVLGSAFYMTGTSSSTVTP